MGFTIRFKAKWASLLAQLVKNPPAVWETWIQSLVGTIPWRRERLPTPVFWPEEFHGLYSPWGRKESDMTERLSLSDHQGVPIFHILNERIKIMLSRQDLGASLDI